MRRPGPYQLQAVIAGAHADAKSWETTRWNEIVRSYDVLLGFADTPVVRLNRAIAVWHVEGPATALAEVDELADELGGTTCSMPRAASCCARSVGRMTRARRTSARSSSPTIPASARFSSAGLRVVLASAVEHDRDHSSCSCEGPPTRRLPRFRGRSARRHARRRDAARGARGARPRAPVARGADARRAWPAAPAPQPLRESKRTRASSVARTPRSRWGHRARASRPVGRIDTGGDEMAKQVVLLVGTKKGLYTLRSDADRKKWTQDGPYSAPAPIHHATYDPRDGSMYAAINSTWGGSRIDYSRDMGKTWEKSKNPAFPEGSDRTFFQTWHIEPGHVKTPNVVWAGHRAGRALEERGPRRDLAAQQGAGRSALAREVGARIRRHGPALDRDRRGRSEEDAGRHQRGRRVHVDRRRRELGAGQRRRSAARKTGPTSSTASTSCSPTPR